MGMDKLPPSVLRKLILLPEAERKIYAQELMGSYGERVTKLQIESERMAQEWLANQAAHFQAIVDYLETVRDTGEIGID